MSVEHDPAFGRRDYDIQIAELRFQVLALQKENSELRIELMNEIKELRVDTKELLEAWKSAKGMTAFVKWLAGLAVAGGIIVATIKGIKIS